LSIDITQFILIFIALALGGILKGATGAGAPILAVPAMAMVSDVRSAVLVMLVPNLLTNLLQAWRFRGEQPSARFVWSFAGAGCLGVLLGTVMLASFASDTLSVFVACVVFGYIAIRLGRPHWRIEFGLAKVLSVPAGALAGLLQGATGLSAPVSITFLNAVRLERLAFIATISVFFTLITVPQIAALGYLGFLSVHSLLISLGAMVPIVACMPLGSALARRFSKESFDRAILVLLAVLAAKLLWDALA
jgi:uncharacterized membrane protein YfcA